ncbi:MAG: GGDEF domain-containing protein [Paraburkholderia sp.]|nr:MAG: GGDEF domain-containing protein [Paraburkholderia sp.]
MLTRRPKLIVAVSVVLAAAISAVTAILLQQMRQDALRCAQQAATNLSLLVERDTARNLELYDLSIQAVINELNDPTARQLDPAVRQKILFDHAATAQDLGAILVTDVKGNVIIDSRSLHPATMNVADQRYFTVHRDSATVGLYVGGPSPSAGGRPTIVLSRRVSNRDGSFAGVVVGSMEVDYFRRLFGGMNLGRGGSMALMLADGTLLMRRPFDDKIIGRRLAGTSNYTRFAQTRSGEFLGVAAIDSVERWYTFRHIGNFPLILDVAMASDDIYSEWRRRAWALGAAMGGLIAGLLSLSALLAHQLKRRRSMEAELRRLAQTDGLTQLANRHAFDQATAHERAHPRGPLSVIMIDIDYFKEFNDLYGHAAGDLALVTVASCIRASVRRLSDVAARYGGEEFVVLLSGANCGEALTIAERICEAVEQTATPHAGSPYRTLTVSVGVASGGRSARSEPGLLIEAADAALYQAKRSGRNRVNSAPGMVREENSNV